MRAERARERLRREQVSRRRAVPLCAVPAGSQSAGTPQANRAPDPRHAMMADLGFEDEDDLAGSGSDRDATSVAERASRCAWPPSLRGPPLILLRRPTTTVVAGLLAHPHARVSTAEDGVTALEAELARVHARAHELEHDLEEERNQRERVDKQLQQLKRMSKSQTVQAVGFATPRPLLLTGPPPRPTGRHGRHGRPARSPSSERHSSPRSCSATS